MPTLKYRDPATGNFLPLLGGSTVGNVYANAAARDTAIPAPAAGMVCYLADWQQQQTYLPGLGTGVPGWYPSGGYLPWGMASSAPSQSIPNANTQVVFPGGTSDTRGGLTWNATTNCFETPFPSLMYWFLVRAVVTTNAAAGEVTFYTGSSTASSTTITSVHIPANAPATPTSTYLQVRSGEMGLWARSTVTRTITFVFQVMYANGP